MKNPAEEEEARADGRMKQARGQFECLMVTARLLKEIPVWVFKCVDIFLPSGSFFNYHKHFVVDLRGNYV